MKKTLLLFAILFSSFSLFAQFTEGQNFCDENSDGSYFPLVIEKKILIWSNTHYIETAEGRKVINGKTYTKFRQAWEIGNVENLYLREEKGVVYQYEECCDKETVRFDSSFKKGHSWKTADGKGTYTILTHDGTFKTPHCTYKNVMILKADLSGGTFKFYYLKGHGYIGATVQDKLISFVTPKLD